MWAGALTFHIPFRSEASSDGILTAYISIALATSPAIPQPGPHDPQSSKRAIINRNPKTWPPFPRPQSLSDDTAQLHLTLRSPPTALALALAFTPSLTPAIILRASYP